MDEQLDLGRGVSIPVSEVELRTSRSSGPGGQHANVTDSRVEAVFDVAASAALDEPERARLLARLGRRVSAQAQDTRSQARNRELALARLRDRLAGALVVARRRRPTRPSRSATERRLAGKREAGERKRARRRPGRDEG